MHVDAFYYSLTCMSVAKFARNYFATLKLQCQAIWKCFLQLMGFQRLMMGKR